MVSPVGAIPGAPIVLTSLIALVAGQIVMGSKSIWLPDTLKKREIPQDKVTTIIDRLEPWAEWIDGFLGQRLTALVGEPMSRVVAALCILLAVTVYPATLIPFAVALPGGAIMLLALGLLTRDGVVMLLGLMVTGGGLWLRLLLCPLGEQLRSFTALLRRQKNGPLGGPF
ncbi:exopolysaccharide biosynthesis protein [Roseibium aggregatum]|uniref:Exopolysaccharide biosynthesis protein n=1 Tax=Roseibium aggregatum TaxID=187304 RepID=A0A939EAL6_9HYPH|nr:exopolysaccharide biosynthesis protein [Roseibium aggregatum]MBN9669408.1 exopolysaccharide biosynthesis protein [Roseibium aggregatum]